MRIILIFFLFPIITFSQEFYPGSLILINNPICSNTSIVLEFQSLPSGGVEGSYSYQWQKSWNTLNWFDIPNATTTTHVTDSLYIDTYYRVNVTYENISIATNHIIVYVLPPLESGVLTAFDTICSNNNIYLDFEIGASGAEWNWGGFLPFSYQWQQNNISEDSLIIDNNNWFDVGENWNFYTTNLAIGTYSFHCIVSSPYGCGSVITDSIIFEIIDCNVGQLENNDLEKKIIKKINILGQASNNRWGPIITIYSDGTIDKNYLLK